MLWIEVSGYVQGTNTSFVLCHSSTTLEMLDQSITENQVPSHLSLEAERSMFVFPDKLSPGSFLAWLMELLVDSMDLCTSTVAFFRQS